MKKPVGLLAVLPLVTLLAACGDGGQADGTHVVASFYPFAYVAEQVGGRARRRREPHLPRRRAPRHRAQAAAGRRRPVRRSGRLPAGLPERDRRRRRPGRSTRQRAHRRGRARRAARGRRARGWTRPRRGRPALLARPADDGGGDPRDRAAIVGCRRGARGHVRRERRAAGGRARAAGRGPRGGSRDLPDAHHRDEPRGLPLPRRALQPHPGADRRDRPDQRAVPGAARRHQRPGRPRGHHDDLRRGARESRRSPTRWPARPAPRPLRSIRSKDSATTAATRRT